MQQFKQFLTAYLFVGCYLVLFYVVTVCGGLDPDIQTKHKLGDFDKEKQKAGVAASTNRNTKRRKGTRRGAHTMLD